MKNTQRQGDTWRIWGEGMPLVVVTHWGSTQYVIPAKNGEDAERIMIEKVNEVRAVIGLGDVDDEHAAIILDNGYWDDDKPHVEDAVCLTWIPSLVEEKR